MPLRGSQRLSWRVRHPQDPDQDAPRSQITEDPGSCPDGGAGGENVVDQQDIPTTDRSSEMAGAKGIGPSVTGRTGPLTLRQPPPLPERDPDRAIKHPGDLLGENPAVILPANPAPEPRRGDGDHAVDGKPVIDEVAQAGLPQSPPKESPHRLPAPELEVPDPGGHGLLVGGQANHPVVWEPLIGAGEASPEGIRMGLPAASAVDGRAVRLPVPAVEMALGREPFVTQQSALELLEDLTHEDPDGPESSVRHAFLIQPSGWSGWG